jgi:phosphonate transport system permease protein
MSTAQSKVRAGRNPLLAAVLSAILPGAGQVYMGDVSRGISLFFVFGTALGTVLWFGHLLWLTIPIFLWIWTIWDAYRLPMQGAPILLAALFWLVMAYGIGWQVTQTDFGLLFSNPERANSILRPMANPDFLQEKSESQAARIKIQLPCNGTPTAVTSSKNGIDIQLDNNCVLVGDKVTITAEGLWPDFPVAVNWIIPQGNTAKVFPATTDAQGKVNCTFQVPPEALAQAPDITLPQTHEIEVRQKRNLGGIEISENGTYVIQGIYETLAMALLATILGALLAIPFGFLAARNLMGADPITKTIYFIVRTILNLVRSIESLILAIIFVTIVGLGTFAGMLAIALHTVAALAKLYSEVIEGIDTGPIEAIRATGADWFEVIRYAVVPQIVPAFTGLTIYRWDINVRSSVIIGFVGGGGIGQVLTQWMNLGDYRAVGTSFIAIAIVVMIMDFFSAKLRERLV